MFKKKAFSLFSEGEGGFITEDQLTRMVKIFGMDFDDQAIKDIMKVVALSVAPSSRFFKLILFLCAASMCVLQCAHIQLDPNKNGKINFSDFGALMDNQCKSIPSITPFSVSPA